MQVSLCMIVLNEEKNLKRCLSSVKGIADEIIIVDTGSTDSTKAVAKEFTNKIFDFKWCDDFSKARNYSFSKATKDFIMWLDADDIILPKDAERLIMLKNELGENIDAVMLKYNIGFDLNGNVTFSYYRERLVNRRRGFLWQEPVHEHIAVSGNIIRRDIAVTHAKAQGVINSGRNVKIYEKLLKKGEELSPRGTYYYARELKDSRNYNLAAIYYKKFIKDGFGWVEDNINACCDLYRCLSILDKERDALEALYKSFVYDLPRAEACCLLGYHYKKANKLDFAVYWFETALKCDKNRVHGFFNMDWHGYVPAIELSLLNYTLGNLQKAKSYNDLAGEFKPGDPAYQHNNNFYASLDIGISKE